MNIHVFTFLQYFNDQETYKTSCQKNILIHIQEFLCIGLFFFKFFSVDIKICFLSTLNTTVWRQDTVARFVLSVVFQ